jgi:probable HAF family extracellular repeat protein
MNDSGKIVGFYSSTTSDAQGFLYDGQTFTTLSFPGFAVNTATGINNLGQVVGWYGNGGSNPDFHGFSWNETFTTIEVLPSLTVLTGINISGLISGFDPVNSRSFVRTPQGMVLFRIFSGGGLAEGINDSSTVVGLNVDVNFNYAFRYNIRTKDYLRYVFPAL